MSQYNFDHSHSGIHFSVRHLMIAKVRGAFTRWSGTLFVDDADPTRSRVEVRIDAASIDTHEDKRDAHLRSPDFFDVGKYPELVFASTAIARDGDDFLVTGDLTIHGVTRAVQLKVEDFGRGRDPWGNERIAFAARASINRKDFGLTWNQALETGGVVVGDKVEIALDVQAIKAAAKAA